VLRDIITGVIKQIPGWNPNMRHLIITLAALFTTLIAVTALVISFSPNTLTTDESMQSAETDNSQQESQDEVLPERDFGRVKQVTVSPYDIARGINKNRDQWSKDQIYEELNLRYLWENLAMESGDFSQCETNCDAKLYKIELDDIAGGAVLLKIMKSLYLCRYLLFKQVDDLRSVKPEWLFLGYIDHDFNKYEMSWHQVANTGNKHWLVIRGQTGSGTGFSSYDDTWYEVSGNGIKEVLNYTARTHIAQWPKGLGVELKSSIILQPNGDDLSAAIKFTVSYSGLNYMTEDYPRLFSRSSSVKYNWDSSKASFVFDPSTSQVSKEEYDSVYQLESWNIESFLRYNLNGLAKIAKGEKVKSKEWLRDFLNECEYTPEKAALIETLKQ
jgi:hypothetical protein